MLHLFPQAAYERQCARLQERCQAQRLVTADGEMFFGHAQLTTLKPHIPNILKTYLKHPNHVLL